MSRELSRTRTLLGPKVYARVLPEEIVPDHGFLTTEKRDINSKEPQKLLHHRTEMRGQLAAKLGKGFF
jgi:hypothetical protein